MTLVSQCRGRIYVMMYIGGWSLDTVWDSLHSSSIPSSLYFFVHHSTMHSPIQFHLCYTCTWGFPGPTCSLPVLNSLNMLWRRKDIASIHKSEPFDIGLLGWIFWVAWCLVCGHQSSHHWVMNETFPDVLNQTLFVVWHGFHVFCNWLYLSSILDANPCLYLDELQSQLTTGQDVDVSISTIFYAVQNPVNSHKCVSKAALERNELLHAMWQAECGNIHMDYFVWLYKSGVDDHMNQHTRGWAALDHACIHYATFIQGQCYSILPALTLDGIIVLDIFEGSINKEKFIWFLKEDLVCTLHLFCLVIVWFTTPGSTTWPLPWPMKRCCLGQLCNPSWWSLWAHCGWVQ